MKLPTRILISAAMFLMSIGVSAADTHIATEVIQPGKEIARCHRSESHHDH
jgi:hypothetical protein